MFGPRAYTMLALTTRAQQPEMYASCWSVCTQICLPARGVPCPAPACVLHPHPKQPPQRTKTLPRTPLPADLISRHRDSRAERSRALPRCALLVRPAISPAPLLWCARQSARLQVAEMTWRVGAPLRMLVPYQRSPAVDFACV